MIDARYARVLALLAWAGFFVWLWASEERVRYLGARTYWVVSFGAITLGICALAFAIVVIRSGRTGPRLAGREAAGLGVVILPLLAVLVVPSGTLGAAAAVKKAAQAAAPVSRPEPPQPGRAQAPSAPPRTGVVESFSELAYVSRDRGEASRLGVVPGLRARLVGFVVHLETTPEGHFELTRFAISCCVADAVPQFVPVDHRAVGTHFPDDGWYEVSGTLVAGAGGTLVLRASRVEEVPVPQQAYVAAF